MLLSALNDNEMLLQEEKKKNPESSRNSEFQKVCVRQELYEYTCIEGFTALLPLQSVFLPVGEG